MKSMAIKFIPALIVAMILLLAPIYATGEGPSNSTPQDLAIKGYDPVAYFTLGKAAQGSPEFQYRWNGALWRFVSAEHRQLFEVAPEKYAPIFGGYCAYGVATGKLLAIDPEVWHIQGGRLQMFHTEKVRKQWLEDPSTFLEEANAKWSEMQVQ